VICVAAPLVFKLLQYRIFLTDILAVPLLTLEFSLICYAFLSTLRVN